MTKRIMGGVVVLIALAFLGACRSQASQPREKLSLDRGWRFHAGDIADAGHGTQGLSVEKWRWCAEPAGATAEAMAAADLPTDGPGWHDASPGEDTFHGREGFAWYRAAVSDPKSGHHTLHFESVDDNATVYLNGKLLGAHEGWSEPFDMALDSAWRQGGPNIVAVRVENTAGAGGIGVTELIDDSSQAAAHAAAALDYDDSSWRQVDVPHDFVVEGDFDAHADCNHGFRPAGIGWYRRTLTVPAVDRGRRLWLEFDGVYRNSRVWVNGRFAGLHASAYTSFRYDITDLVRYGQKNVITVRADAGHFEGWWYEGGGIYRHVYLTETNPVAVKPWGVFVKPQVSDVGDGIKGKADVLVETTLQNQGAPGAGVLLRSEVRDAGGLVMGQCASPQVLPAGGSVVVAQKVTLGAAELWSIERPYLYRMVTTLESGGRVVDRVETPFGIRQIRFDNNAGFFLNGKPVKIKGTCNHQDFAGIGVALPDSVHAYKVEKLKEMGSNGFRFSHHPMAPELLDACDRLGMLVMDENRKLGSSTEILGQVESMVLRDRNHPSIVIWSLCNEEGLQGTPAGEHMGRAMKAIIDRLDGTRPVTAAQNGGYDGGLINVVDVQGFNYHEDQYTKFHEAHPQQPIIATETASTTYTRGEYADDKDRGYVSAYHSGEGAWRPVADRPYVSGAFVWTGFDYRGEPSPYKWPCVNSHFGILDTCGFPKDDYYYYQSWWSNKTVLHLLPHWNWDGVKKPGEKIAVKAYSNCDKVELFLNGQSLGAKDMPRNSHVDWQVPWQPGVLSAKGFKGDVVVTQTRVETTGPAAALTLSPDRTALKADGEDCVMVAAAITDAQGRTLPLADNEVTFAVRGNAKIIGVGNGDPSCHDPDKANHRKAFNGLCMVIVQMGRWPGSVEISAQAAGLRATAIKVQAGLSVRRPQAP